MRAIILAGGLGHRLGPLTAGLQKCLLEVDGEAILTRAVRLILSAGIAEITVVTGHCASLVREELARYLVPDETEPHLRGRVSVVHNPHYASTDTAYPLWLARFAFDAPLLLVDGDVVFDEAPLSMLLNASAAGDVIAVSRTRGGDRPIVTVDALGRVSRVSRHLEPTVTSLRATGLTVLSRATLTHFFPALERRVITRDRTNDPYEAAFEDLLAAERVTMCALDLDGFRCVAVDEPEDLQRARVSFEESHQGVRTLQ